MRWSVGALGSSVHFAVVVGAGEVGDDGDCKGKGHLRLKAAAPLSSTRQPCLPASVLQRYNRVRFALLSASHTFGGLYFFAVAHLSSHLVSRRAPRSSQSRERNPFPKHNLK